MFPEGIDCGPPEPPAYGRVNIPDGTTFGSRVWYVCNEGFLLIGSEFRTCEADGRWFPEVPFCGRKFIAYSWCVATMIVYAHFLLCWLHELSAIWV